MFANFIIGVIGNETGHLKLYGTFINISEAYHMLRRSIVCKNLFAVKCCDKTYECICMKSTGNFRLGLNLF